MIKTLPLSAALLLLLSVLSSAATPVSTCTDINQPGQYALAQDLAWVYPRACISINADKLLAEYEELKRKGRENEAGSVLAKLAGLRSQWLSLASLVLAVGIVLAAFFYSSSLKAPPAATTGAQEKPSPNRYSPPELVYGDDLKKRIAELRRKLGK